MTKPTPGKDRKVPNVPMLGPIEEVPPELLKPYDRNARTHSDRQIVLIAQSIETFGFNNPIIAEEDGTIIAGHGRWEAAKRLGIKQVPILRARHLTPEKIRAYRLADNRLAELSGWDTDLQALEIGALNDLDLGFSIETLGWTHAEIDVMLDPPEEAGGDGPRDALDSEIPDRPAEPVSRSGDLWTMGEHRLLVGSSLEPSNFQKLMAGRKAALLCQDVPYNVPVNGHVSGLGRTKHREFAMASGEMSAEEFKNFLAANLVATIPHLDPGAIMALFMDHRGLFTLQLALREVGAEQINLAVWVKSNGGMGSLYRSQHELVVIAKHDKAPHINNVQLGKYKRYRTNVWRYPGVNSFGRHRMDQIESHPTPKPIALVADAIRDVTNRSQIVFDGFMGSGTTILAAERTGRIAYGIEIDPGYIDVTIQRWEKMTKREAVLEGTSETFAQVKARRAHEAGECT